MRSFFITTIALAAFMGSAQAQSAEVNATGEGLPPEVIAKTADELTWQSTGALAKDGIKQANLIGAPDKVGPYTVRLSFPAGYKLAPHSHPDARHITILSGVWMTGYGKTFDPKKLKTLPAGSFYTEPANLPHFVLVTEPTVIQVSGTGPSGRLPVEEDHKH